MRPMNNSPLGKTQTSVLSALVEHKSWYAGCGWTWTTDRNTERLLDSLVRRGLVERTEVQKERLGLGPRRGTVTYTTDTVAEYRPTTAAAGVL